jgi:general secretion pathway protein H
MGRSAEVIQRSRGFTLLELIVTLAVLAVAAAVVAPAIGRGSDSLKARADVASFAATLRHAREKAINAQRPHRVEVDMEGHRMSIIAAPALADDKEVRVTRSLSTRLMIEASPSPAVTFDPRGVSSGADFKLTSGGIVYLVSVDRLTGRVKSTRQEAR